ncbi:serine/threonine protein kinase, putative [Entamoeba invadens IP1]|uniref:Serine/threonine protein kinase, putative n=1 Tax=Entamoeba invadens IP1 TaxID=370355 RepID=A0A0A1UAK9_ENTIV|nr:serine/threonine protein kinase, putative [Entamoeba invadens IP1]ELP89213.1 serine/threonine protein kinase, putative [Entamoeba invadens IP1]|eukprot:XP_004255984.1 serine/threonine protein kinase, putative [Entamoeba invadens IP1]
MKQSNVSFTKLSNGILVNKTVLDFNEEIAELPIGESTRQLICIGNANKNPYKIQFSIKEEETKFTLKINPELIVLKHGEACEFEILLVPNYTTKIDSKMVVIAKSLKVQKEIYNDIKIEGNAALSTRLDPTELIDNEKVGEGSFGVVYKGTFRGNLVAIKKLKNISNEENVLDEFTKEIEMLDKFRCDYIVHFYGAVFIINKMSMVTEFAKYGSLKDLIQKESGNFVTTQMRSKFMLDASRGLMYLHTNGILHRDIKTDNILIFSIESGMVNAKLTDFGASRNINLLMTNMTFTKGIGTPKYMAPEVLSREHYKKSADIFSLGVTMLECFKWGEVYPKSEFKFAWDIVNFVTNGKRIKNDGTVRKDIFNIIQNCWCQDQKDRISAENVVNALQTLVF